MPKFPKINWSKILAGYFAVDRINSMVREYIPDYAEWIDNLEDRIKRKLRMRKSFWDDIALYVSDDDAMETSLEFSDRASMAKFFSIISERCHLEKCIPLSPEFYAKLGDTIHDACIEENISPKITVKESPLHTQIVSKTIENYEGKLREDQPLEDFFKPTIGFRYMTGASYLKIDDYPFVMFLDSPIEVEDQCPMAYFFSNTNSEDKIDEFIASIKKELRSYNPYNAAILTSFRKNYSKTEFSYDEDQTIELRLSKRKFDLSFYDEKVQKAVNDDILQFIGEKGGRRSYLLAGPPGCGKTQLIKDIISILPIEYTVAIIDGDGIAGLVNMNTDLAFIKPLCVVIEDIDLIMENGDERQILLNFLDGISSRKNMLTIMTANKPSVLGHVFLRRPGRIDRIIKVLPGGVQERIAQLKLLTKGLKLPISIEKLAELTDGFSFAQHSEFIQRARLYSKKGKKLDEENTLAALGECREQFSQNLSDWSNLALDSKTPN